jgi:hypothetical protein
VWCRGLCHARGEFALWSRGGVPGVLDVPGKDPEGPALVFAAAAWAAFVADVKAGRFPG